MIAFLKGRIDGNLAIVDKRLAGPHFMLGERPTIADVSLAHISTIRRRNSASTSPARTRTSRAWLERIKALPGWKHPYELMPGHPPQL